MIREFAAHVLARIPPGWSRRLRAVPLVGSALHALSHRVSPPGKKLWLEVQAGPGEGLRLQLDPRYEGEFWLGTHERVVQEHLAALLEPGWVVYDVGAHIGFFSLIAARLVGPEGAVFAFEPDPENLRQLRVHVEENGARNVRLVPSPVWSARDVVSFVVDTSHPIRSYGRVGGRGGAETLSLRATTLDDFSRSEGRLPDLIKIDVEGGEVEVLQGAVRLLEAARPVVFCEVHLEGGARPDRLATITQLLRANGYGVEQLTPGLDPTHVVAR